MINITITTTCPNAVTHAGTFHADDVLATVMLGRMMPIRLMRTFRVPADLPEDVIVYDIGGGKYDHHMPGGNGKHPGTDVSYASAGLIWRDFGERILQTFHCPTELIPQVKKAIEHSLVLGVDATDNGESAKEGEGTYLAYVVRGFNPTWDSNRDPDDAFVEACSVVDSIFYNVVRSCIATGEAQKEVNLALQNRITPEILVLGQFVPWQAWVVNNEKAKDVLYVVFPDSRGGTAVQAVPKALGSFENRKPFPEAWRGHPENSGIAGCHFVHNSGFFAACDDELSAMLLARKAVES